MTTSTNRRILVTGGFGFIGTHLVEHLLLDPINRVHVVDSLESSPLSLNRILSELRFDSRLTYEIAPLREFIRRTRRRFDEVYHLASIVGPARIGAFAGQMVSRAVEDIELLIEFAHRTDTSLLMTSSSEVYGGPERQTCREDAPILLPPVQQLRTEYAIAKVATEAVLLGACRTSSLFCSIVRVFNAAGPRQSAAGGFVIPRFVAQALSGEPLTVFGDGRQERCFTHVSEIAEGLVVAMRRSKSGDIYNLGNPENRISIASLAHLVLRESQSQSDVINVDARSLLGTDFSDRCAGIPEISRARADLGWSPKQTTAEIVRDCLTYAARVH